MKFSDYLNEAAEIKINDVDIMPAVDRGLAAFWREVRMSFPNSKSKDLMPDLAAEFRAVAEKVTKAWLKENADSANKDAPVSFSSFNRNPYATQTTQWNEYHP
jgi:hypothetical protein